MNKKYKSKKKHYLSNNKKTKISLNRIHKQFGGARSNPNYVLALDFDQTISSHHMSSKFSNYLRENVKLENKSYLSYCEVAQPQDTVFSQIEDQFINPYLTSSSIISTEVVRAINEWIKQGIPIYIVTFGFFSLIKKILVKSGIENHENIFIISPSSLKLLCEETEDIFGNTKVNFSLLEALLQNEKLNLFLDGYGSLKNKNLFLYFVFFLHIKRETPEQLPNIIFVDDSRQNILATKSTDNLSFESLKQIFTNTKINGSPPSIGNHSIDSIYKQLISNTQPSGLAAIHVDNSKSSGITEEHIKQINDILGKK